MKKVFEAELIAAIENRSAFAFAVLYDRYAAILFKIIFIHVKDQELAENLLEESFLTICNQIQGYHAQDSGFLLWMTGMAKKLALQKINESVPCITKRSSSRMAG